MMVHQLKLRMQNVQITSSYYHLWAYIETNFTRLCIIIVWPQTSSTMISLHHMASLQSASSCNCTSYAGIVSLMYSNTPPPLLPIPSLLNIT